MPEMQQNEPAAAGMPPVVLTAGVLDDDLALGCECADPMLQIERWLAECGQPPLETRA